jgi:guanosine-3',5'-bis(diphosphate) 3'-pyrophosphohydrolase
MNDNLLLKAAYFAAEKHRNQKRKGVNGEPYINHPLLVALTLSNNGVKDEEVLASALLHDTIEDTETTVDELENAFGIRVASMVLEVTDDKSLPKLVRKEMQVEHASFLIEGAAMIKIADKISNIQDVTNRPPENWDLERRTEYLNWAIRVVNNCRTGNDNLKEEFQLQISQSKRKLSA